jgi:hypothetical protein
VVDETTVRAPVGSDPMEAWEHLQSWRAHKEVLERAAGTLHQLREEIGREPRRLRSRAIIERISDGPRFQLYLPDFGVAGEGRCVCEASLEAIHAFEQLLESALEHKTWDVLPAPDRSLRAFVAAKRTDLFLALHRFLDDRISSEAAHQCTEVESALDLALA